MASNKSEFSNPDELTVEEGYTLELIMLNEDIKRKYKFLGVFVKLNLMHYRVAQVIGSNYGQKRFQELRDSASF